MSLAEIARGTGIDDVDVRVICNSLPLIAWTSSARGASESLNEYGRAYTGLSPHDGENWDWFSLTHPDDLKPVRQHWKKALRATTEFSRQYRLRRYDGVYRWHEVRALPVYDTRNHLRTWIGTAVDIEDKVVAETALDRSLRTGAEKSALLDALLKDAPIGIAFVDRNYRVLRVNDYLANIVNTTTAASIGSPVSEAIPEAWPEVKVAFDAILAGGPAAHNVPIIRPSSTDTTRTNHWSASYYPVLLGDEILGIGIVAADVTAEHDKDNQQLLLATIIEGSGDAIFSALTDGTITSWNPAAEKLFNYRAPEIVGKSMHLLVPPEYLEQHHRVQENVIQKRKPERIITSQFTREGVRMDVEMTISPIVDTKGDVVGISRIAHDETEQLAQERRLRESQRQLMETQRIAHVGGVQYDVVRDTMTWSEETFRILGIDTKETPSRQLFMTKVHPDDAATIRDAWFNGTLRGIPFDVSFRIILSGGEERHVSARGEVEYDEDHAPLRMAGMLTDDTEGVLEEKARRALELRFEASFEQSAIGTSIFSLEGICLRVNEKVCDFFGRPREELVGRDWIGFTSPDEMPAKELLGSINDAGTKAFIYERRYIRSDGEVVQASVHVIIVRDEDGTPLYLYSHMLDVTELKRVEEELAHLATHDSLTNLPNRALLDDRLAQSLARNVRSKGDVNVMFLDIDDFKEINDTMGHKYGDELLVHVANQISHAIRPEDTLARFGGDEFVVICEGANNGEIDAIANRVLRSINEPLTLADSEVRITGSMGMSVSNEHSTPDSMLKNADFAMYRAKGIGQGSVAHYDVGIHEKVEERLATTAALRLGIARNEFVVLYQPVIDIWTGALVSVEALVRWEHPNGVTVNPDQFIPLAEHSGLIVPIGAWVLEEACEQIVKWKKAIPTLTMAVNLSVRQVLDPDIVATVKGALTRSKLPPADLSLELTESLLMENVEECARILNELKDLGVELVIDDFGTGYSSLSYLKLFPFDAVKIDRAFVDGLGSDTHDTALVAAIIAMSSALDLDVIAEGVETKTQLARLKGLDCQRAQGFYFSKPVSSVDLAQLILDGHHWDVS
jgi:diguanylate cyclase (GGDEF)-like protein/PAS domain S-box-containing protein